MFGAVTDFIRNAGLTTFVHFLVTAISILIGFAWFFLARTRREMSFFLAVGILPAVSGILAMYFKYKYSNVGMFAPPGPEEIAAAKREAWIDLSVGLAAAVMIVFLRSWRRRLIVKRDG
jgi:hypothetical protein